MTTRRRASRMAPRTFEPDEPRQEAAYRAHPLAALASASDDLEGADDVVRVRASERDDAGSSRRSRLTPLESSAPLQRVSETPRSTAATKHRRSLSLQQQKESLEETMAGNAPRPKSSRSVFEKDGEVPADNGWKSLDDVESPGR